MTLVIYAWPPVASVSTLWTDIAPIRESFGANSGRRFVSSAGPRRRKAMVSVPALAKARDGAGLSESLKHLLDGGVNLVRLPSPAVNWHLDAARNLLKTAPLGWTVGGDPLEWTHDGQPLYWFTGPTLQVTAGTAAPFAALNVTGAPPGALLCRAYDGIRVYAADGSTSAFSRAVRTVYAESDGTAVVPVHDALPGGIVSFGDHESAVFAVDGPMPESPQPLGANWFYQWNFREVLPSELPASIEVNPWA